MKNRKWQKSRQLIACGFAALLAIGSLAACGGGSTESEQSVQTGAVSASAQTVGEVTVLDVSDLFTDRDKEIGYEEADCELITMEGDTAVSDSAGVDIAGGTVTITAEGTYLLRGTLAGSIVIDTDDSAKVQLILDGADIACEGSAALYVVQADKVFVTTAAGSENSLVSTGEFVQTDDNNVDGAIFAKDDLTLNGAGSLTVSCETGHGIVCKNDLRITSGTYEITAASHGIQAKDSMRILSGTIAITAGEDGIHSGNDEDETVGYTYIGGGELTITAGDDGIHADTELVVAGGTVTVTESYEGLEGNVIEIAGGTIDLTASDDGLNAAGGSDGSGQMGGFGGDLFDEDESCSLIVSGGSLTVNAGGDGLDSNGGLYVYGGELVVYGPTDSGNGALDYGTEAVITGGTVIAFGSSGMAENFGDGSTQCAILVNFSTQEAGTSVTLTDGAGNVLLTAASEKSYSSVVLSSPDLEIGQTYTLTAGDATETIELTDTIYGNGSGMGGMHDMNDLPDINSMSDMNDMPGDGGGRRGSDMPGGGRPGTP